VGVSRAAGAPYIRRRPSPPPADADAVESCRRALLVFLDGLGIGPGDPAFNPLASDATPRLERLLGGRRLVAESLENGCAVTPGAVLAAADATLGTPGIPQSGTGQTALLTGHDAPRAYGRHFGPWVPTTLRPLLERENVLARARAAGLDVAFANAYPAAGAARDPRIFRRPAGPPLAAASAGALTRGAAELAEGRAVASSITNERWREHLGDAVPVVTPEDAARTLARITAGAALTLFAHYDTDYRGHRGGAAGAREALERVDAFLGALIEALPADALLVVSSDHGNLEDLRGGHTTNPVPVLAAGPGREALAGVRSLLGVAPALLRAVGVEGGSRAGGGPAPDHEREGTA
jgi:2,3-bisphosphoglycerate-independent phosphoglycerate mutase